MIIITCRPSLALLRGPFIIVFRAEFSSIEGTINNQQLTLTREERSLQGIYKGTITLRALRVCMFHVWGSLSLQAYNQYYLP